MKKVFYIAAAAALGLMSSCTEELDQKAPTGLAPDGKFYIDVTVTNPSADTRTVFDPATYEVSWLDTDEIGVALRPLSENEKKELNLSHGLVVSAIRDGKMKEAGVTKGIIIMQVNDRKMNTTEDFEQAVKEANMSSDRVLWIRAKTQSGLNRSFTVELADPKAKNKK